MKTGKFIFAAFSIATVFGAGSLSVSAVAATPFLPLAQTHVTSPFGMRVHPITGHEDFHSGVDLAASLNEPVQSVLSGTVTQAGPRGLLGNAVEISHGRYGVSSIYGHLNQVLVHTGEGVNKGTVIGLAGSTGRSTGPHVHFTIKRNDNGQDIEPIAFLKNANDYGSGANYLATNAFSSHMAAARTSYAFLQVKMQSDKQRRLEALAASKAALASASAQEKIQQSKLVIAEQYMTQARLNANKFLQLYRAGAVSRLDAEGKVASAKSAEQEVASLQQQLGLTHSTIRTANSRLFASRTI